MTINIALATEQEQRLKNDSVAIEAEIDKETDYFSVGKFDGLIGGEPTRVEDRGYWSGYQIGLRQYWAKKLGITIATEF